MKLGVSYNVFDGEELLESSIKSIRSEVDYISVVYQTVSNFGNQCSEELVSLLDKLVDEGLVDEIFKYKPNIKWGGHRNEITKRNIGLSLSKGNGCTHHMSMDSDEFYIKEQLYNLKVKMEKGGYDSSFCRMRTYFKDPRFEVRPMNEYYVSVIYKISPNNEFVFGKPTPVLVDPTRRMNSITPLIMKREDLEMYHMSYVKKNIKSKLENSSSKSAFKDINRFLTMFDKYDVGETFFTTHPPGNETTILVDNKFDILL
jgi:hypothetical protein